MVLVLPHIAVCAFIVSLKGCVLRETCANLCGDDFIRNVDLSRSYILVQILHQSAQVAADAVDLRECGARPECGCANLREHCRLRLHRRDRHLTLQTHGDLLHHLRRTLVGGRFVRRVCEHHPIDDDIEPPRTLIVALRGRDERRKTRDNLLGRSRIERVQSRRGGIFIECRELCPHLEPLLVQCSNCGVHLGGDLRTEGRQLLCLIRRIL